jgi:hypothetical protein
LARDGLIRFRAYHDLLIFISAEALQIETCASGLGRQTLATARAACSENLAAVFGSETGAKAVAAFTHKFTGLIGAFHSAYSGLVLCSVKTECLEGEMKCQNDKNDRRTRSILLTLITRKNDRGLMKDRREKVNAPDGFLWSAIGFPDLRAVKK